MSSMKSDSQNFDLNTVLDSIPNLNIDDLKKVLSKVNTFIARKKVPHFSKEEAALILKIHDVLPEDVEARYKELQEKVLQEKITDKEHQELLNLIKISEQKANERLKYIIELSFLWETSTDEVMERLDLKPPPSLHA